MSELASDFEFSRPERPAFDVLPLCEPLAPWFALLVPLDFPLDFDLVSLLVPLPENEGSLLDHDLLCLPLPYDCLCLCVHCSPVENVLHRT